MESPDGNTAVDLAAVQGEPVSCFQPRVPREVSGVQELLFFSFHTLTLNYKA